MIEKILKEINKLKKELDGYSALEALDYIESYINTLSEEHNEDLEEVADKYAQQHSELLGFDCDCEPIQTGPELKKALKFGAEWQKQKDFEDLLKSDMTQFKKCYEKGRFDMREEMMKALVDGEVMKNLNNQLCVKSEPIKDTFGDLKFGDKVKIIIPKTE